MFPNLDSRHCHLDENNTCKLCGRKYPTHRVIAMCRKGTLPADHTKPSYRRRRERTKEEQMDIVRSHCNNCEHQLKQPTEDLDQGVCLLRVKGCGSCKTLDRFWSHLAKGNQCPATPPRFPATEVVEVVQGTRTSSSPEKEA